MKFWSKGFCFQQFREDQNLTKDIIYWAFTLCKALLYVLRKDELTLTLSYDEDSAIFLKFSSMDDRTKIYKVYVTCLKKHIY